MPPHLQRRPAYLPSTVRREKGPTGQTMVGASGTAVCMLAGSSTAQCESRRAGEPTRESVRPFTGMAAAASSIIAVRAVDVAIAAESRSGCENRG